MAAWIDTEIEQALDSSHFQCWLRGREDSGLLQQRERTGSRPCTRESAANTSQQVRNSCYVHVHVDTHSALSACQPLTHSDYVPIVIQMACSWCEHLLLCPSQRIPGLSQVAIVPCISWVGSSTSMPCSPFCDPNSLFTSSAISVFISRSSSKESYSLSTLSNTSCLPW